LLVVDQPTQTTNRVSELKHDNIIATHITIFRVPGVGNPIPQQKKHTPLLT
jgi:hypothetical protein